VFDKNPFDVIAGSGSMRKQIEENASLGDIKSSWKLKLDEFELQRQGFLIY
jgi:uncharacterized protein YbbC (DUF1343 family)